MYDDEEGRPAASYQQTPIADVTADAVLEDTFECPVCREHIKIGALLCRFCRTDLRPQPIAQPVAPPGPPPAPTVPTQSNTPALVLLSLFALCGVVLFGATRDCKPPVIQDPGRAPDRAAQPVRPAPKTMSQRVEEARTIEGALATASFDDSVDTIDPGAAAFARWASTRMRWPDVNGIRETNFASTMKDSRAARGKRGCFDGTVVEIAADHTAPETVWIGGLSLDGDALRIVRFVAVHDSSGVVAGTEASLCGVVTGRYDYTGSASNVVHAIFVVGMLDTPPNRRHILPATER